MVIAAWQPSCWLFHRLDRGIVWQDAVNFEIAGQPHEDYLYLCLGSAPKANSIQARAARLAQSGHKCSCWFLQQAHSPGEKISAWWPLLWVGGSFGRTLPAASPAALRFFMARGSASLLGRGGLCPPPQAAGALLRGLPVPFEMHGEPEKLRPPLFRLFLTCRVKRWLPIAGPGRPPGKTVPD
jgi:hypothetical protein